MTTTKQNPRALAGDTGAIKTHAAKFTARQARVLGALMQTEWIPRESIDHIAGASNGPHVIAELRRKVTGHDGIEMVQIEVLDRDGKPTRPGRYHLNAIGLARVQASGFTGAAT